MNGSDIITDNISQDIVTNDTVSTSQSSHIFGVSTPLCPRLSDELSSRTSRLSGVSTSLSARFLHISTSLKSRFDGKLTLVGQSLWMITQRNGSSRRRGSISKTLKI